MSIHSGGNGNGIQVRALKHNRQAPGVIAPESALKGHKFTKDNAAQYAALGGKAKGGKTKMAITLGLGKEHPVLKQYYREGALFARATIKELATTVGGGTCGVAASSMVLSAGWQLAASRYLFDHGTSAEDFRSASSLANDSRQNLLAARDIVARAAKDRSNTPMTLTELEALEGKKK